MYWVTVGEVRVQRGKSFVRGGGLLVRAAAMAETAVGESPSTGDLLDVCSCITSDKRAKIVCSYTICGSDQS